ncbi:hypothetical protein B0H10DRAFT_1966912 [Mycena sp. CBHHK59/15]|nr:hypothetical protein B0H10DRAFT_1966912 [Mycena sp. CBHHK59/15]
MSTNAPTHHAPRTLITCVHPSISLWDRRFPPIYNNLPAITQSDPYGLLPFNRRIRATRSCLLEWSSKEKRLTVFLWPVENGQRVPPSDFAEYHRTHIFHYPCCLCSMHEVDPNHITESAVFMVTSGPLSGDFLGALVSEARSSNPYIHSEANSSAVAPPEVLYEAEEEPPTPTSPSVASGSSSSRPLRRAREDSSEDLTPTRPFKRLRHSGSTRVSTGSSSPVNPFIVPYATPEPRTTLTTPFSMLMQLDASSNAGLTEMQFRKLAFEDHNCRPTGVSNEIIDLTGDD